METRQRKAIDFGLNPNHANRHANCEPAILIISTTLQN
jgi:hypothetical protein